MARYPGERDRSLFSSLPWENGVTSQLAEVKWGKSWRVIAACGAPQEEGPLDGPADICAPSGWQWSMCSLDLHAALP